MDTTRVVLALGAALLASAAGWTATQESAEVMRLRQEVDSLRYRLDFEVQQLRQRVDSLESGPGRVDPRPAPGPEPAPVEPRPPVAGTRAPEFTARRFVVEDERGRIRAIVAVSDIHGPMLGLLDEQGELRALLSQSGPDDVGLRLLGADGLERVTLELEGGEPVLRLRDSRGGEREVRPDSLPGGAR